MSEISASINGRFTSLSVFARVIFVSVSRTFYAPPGEIGVRRKEVNWVLTKREGFMVLTK